jgi:hypothetical protein
MAVVGRASYSIYLVHWPVVLSRRALPDLDASILAVLGIAVSMMLGFASHLWIETPFRMAQPATARAGLRRHAAATLLIAGFATVVAWAGGFVGDTESAARRAIAFIHYDPRADYQAGRCFLDPPQRAEDVHLADCLPTVASVRTVVLWGDSHAAHLLPGLGPWLAQHGESLGLLAGSLCPPLLDFDAPGRPIAAI